MARLTLDRRINFCKQSFFNERRKAMSKPKICGTCIFWNMNIESKRKFGQCRVNPPVLSEAILQQAMASYHPTLSDLFHATQFPLSREYDVCGKWEDDGVGDWQWQR